MVAGSDGGADQRANPEDPLQIRTCLLAVVVSSENCVNLSHFLYMYCLKNLGTSYVRFTYHLFMKH
jgi:hypothetical protein